jgi:hypothetical protein
VIDVAYLVRPGDRNDELRLSLRSIAAHVPHRRVVLAGHRPSFVDPDTVVHLATEQTPGAKYVNAFGNLEAICHADGLTDRVVLMNDDFYVLRPVAGEIPPMHRGTVAQHLEGLRRRRISSPYVDALVATGALLEADGHDEPLSYGVHVPLVIDRAAMAAVLERCRSIGNLTLHLRTLYGNTAGIGGARIVDPKIRFAPTGAQLARPYLSTSDQGWSLARRPLERLFPAPSPYEATIRPTRARGAAASRTASLTAKDRAPWPSNPYDDPSSPA